MGGAASCLALSTNDPAYRYAYEASGAPVRLNVAYSSRPGTAAAPARSSSFAARRQPLKPYQDAIQARPSFGGNPSLHLFGVFDGHGVDGAIASRLAADHVEAVLLKELRARSGGGLDNAACLTDEAVTAACKAAFLGAERALGRTLEMDDSFSGTTAVIVLLIGRRLFAASAGDSRAVLGKRTDEKGYGASAAVVVDALTWDHNPYRADERARIQKVGGVIMCYDRSATWQALDGGDGAREPPPPSLDPPRVWDKTLSKPGCCFTRSLGDSFAKTLGMIAEPEVSGRVLEAGASYVLCLASDGVFEVLGNAQLLTLAAAHPDRPLHACRAICARSMLLAPPAGRQETPADRERRRLMYHQRDDTTLICVHLHVQEIEAATPP